MGHVRDLWTTEPPPGGAKKAAAVLGVFLYIAAKPAPSPEG